jgi:trimethylamine:corrinoid methyltransferase-like protein
MSGLRLEVLTQAETERILAQTLQVLERLGFRVLDRKCRRLLAKAGATVDEDDRVVKLPPTLVGEALALAPSTIELHRQGGRMLRLGGGHRVYSSLEVDPWIVDYQTQKPRRPALDDIVRHTQLGDALPRTDAIRPVVFKIERVSD